MELLHSDLNINEVNDQLLEKYNNLLAMMSALRAQLSESLSSRALFPLSSNTDQFLFMLRLSYEMQETLTAVYDAVSTLQELLLSDLAAAKTPLGQDSISKTFPDGQKN